MRIKATVITFAALLLLPATLYADEPDTNKSLKKTFLSEILTLEGYRPNYIALANDGAIKFQISARKRIMHPLPVYFAYTQRSFWEIFENSSVFNETNYNPEFFYVFGNDRSEAKTGITISHWRLGAEHESNGRGGQASRGWSAIYIEPTLNYTWGVESAELSIAPRILYPFLISKNNSDILDYYGYMELMIKYTADKGQLALIGRKGIKGLHGHIQIDMSYNFFNRPYFNSYLQLWYGDGESLLKYDKEVARILVGVMLTKW